MSEQLIQRDPSGNILDMDGAPVGKKLEGFVTSRNSAVDEVASATSRVSELSEKKLLGDAIKESAYRSGGSINEHTGAVIADSTQDSEVLDDAKRVARNAQDTLGYLTDHSASYYEANKDAVQQHAIEDATAAEHKISFGGQHSPNQTSEQHK